MSDIEIIKRIERETLKALPLHENVFYNVYDVGYMLDNEKQVVSLNLSYINFEKFPNLIFLLENLSRLQRLTLASSEIKKLDSISKLVNLTSLNLSTNQIIDLSPLKNLTNLQKLDLGQNQIEDISVLSNLTALEELDLTENPVKSINSLKELSQLRILNLSYTHITDISSLDKKSLTHLYLHGFKSDKIDTIKSLKNLRGLYLCQSTISDVSPLEKLTKLRQLYLNNNKISSVKHLSSLKRLNHLSLTGNKISDISPLYALTQIKYLNLSKNLIEELPPWLLNFKSPIIWLKEDRDLNNDGINLYNNPLKKPPLSVIKQGNEGINRYFKKIYKEGIDYIYEAKLTLVGEGNAGKTSLQVRLIDPKAPLPQEDKRTRGIKIHDWKFKSTNRKPHIAHIWDFGGQDVYYPVHRFFLTENSVFVLLASTRQTNHNFDYWIPTIYQFGGKSPIIIGQTCHDGNKAPWNDLGNFLSNTHFNIIKTQLLPYQELNLPNKNEGLNKIKQSIMDQLVNLPYFGKGVPKSWVVVRDAIAIEAENSACITYEKFKSICFESNSDSFNSIEDIDDCAKFLHSIGVILWYYENEELRNWVVLQPEWAMNAVYEIIDDTEIQKPNRRGYILANDFKRLWKNKQYEGTHSILKKMLEVFKIAFPKKHKVGDYIMPARMLSMPPEARWINNEPYLRLEYKFEFMPKGIVNQISAELSRYVSSDHEVWNNAVNLSYDSNKAQCQIEEDFYNRKISVKAKGRDARSLTILVMNALNDITDGYKGVEPEIIVPCICSKCQTIDRPSTFYYEDLLRWSSEEENSIVFCNEGRVTLKIEDLLYNVGLAKPNKVEHMSNKTIKIFLASSAELKNDRERFEIFISRENKKFNKKGVFLELNLWEDFIDAMSSTRLQDEYNKEVQASDIFVSLFFTKVGKYTLEEFDQAYGKFITTGKPLVYTYFKNASIDMDSISKEDFDSKHLFKEKLKSLGHYPTTYTSTEDLLNHFKSQLEKLYPEY